VVRVVVARIGRAHGIRGEVSVELRTDSPRERFTDGAVLHVGAGVIGAPETLTVERVRDHNGTLLLTFAEAADRTAADALRNLLLEADVPDDEDDDAWYEEQLVGLRALDPAGRELGEVTALDVDAPQHRLTVRTPDGVLRLVPFVHEIVPVVDPAAGHVVIDAPPGLLD
jgi:16S rRNA processing protein RimM